MSIRNLNEANTNQTIDRRSLTIDDVEKLLKLFWPERTIGIGIGIISLGVLIWCAYSLLTKEKPDVSSVISMCGSSGGIMISFGMVYKMFNDLMKRLH